MNLSSINYSKELLLGVATVLVTVGTVQIVENLWTGVALLILGALVFVGRGFYKKFIQDKEISVNVNIPPKVE